MNKQELLEKLQLINEMSAKKKKEWEEAEDAVKDSLKTIGHTQCDEAGGCGHQVDAMAGGHGISIGHGHQFGTKDVGQGTLKLEDNGRGGRKWTHEATSKALQRFVGKKRFTHAIVGGVGGALKRIRRTVGTLTDLLTSHYGTNLKAPKTPIKSGREKKHLSDESMHIHTHGELYVPVDGRILGAHHREHHGSMYHVQHTIDKKTGKRTGHLYRTTTGAKSNPLNVFDKKGNPPPVFGQGADVTLRVRAKDSTRNKKTGFYNRRAATAIKASGNVNDSPSTIDILDPHRTIHSSSGIFVNEADRAKAKQHE
jgi:hypothetical protein